MTGSLVLLRQRFEGGLQFAQPLRQRIILLFQILNLGVFFAQFLIQPLALGLLPIGTFGNLEKRQGSAVNRNPFDDRNNSWQRESMLTDVAKSKVTPMQVMDDLARLTGRQLETVIQRASVLRLQKRKGVMSARESDLMRVINRGLSAEKSARLNQLQEKLREETIHPRERQQLLRLSDELEKLGAQRLKALIELAVVRKKSVPKLMVELGLNDAGYA
jgi:hypothetical protein